jgi:prepilin-type N-terminal cleavage/methylation domain-containing protein
MPRPERRSAFTLLELLSAMSILSIIVALLFAAFRGSSDAALRNQNKIEVNQAVRAVLDQIARDLERIQYQGNAINLYSDAGGMLIPGVVPTNALYFLTYLPDPEPNAYGSIVNVGYQIAQTNVGGFNKWVLLRGDDPAVDVVTCSNSWWNFAVCPFNAGTDPNDDSYNPDYWKLLSENVIGLRFDFYTNALAAGGGADQSTPTWNSTSIPNALPYCVKATVFSIDTDAYNKALRIDPTLTGPGTNLILANVHANSVRVFLPCSTANP